MNEEDIIKKMTEGKENPFRVPDGYFEGFTARLMSQLPAAEQAPAQERKREKQTIFRLQPAAPESGARLRPSVLWRYAAILFVVAGVGLTLLFTNNAKDNLAESEATEEYQEDYINDALDYALIGNTNIEIYLTEAN